MASQRKLLCTFFCISRDSQTCVSCYHFVNSPSCTWIWDPTCIGFRPQITKSQICLLQLQMCKIVWMRPLIIAPFSLGICEGLGMTQPLGVQNSKPVQSVLCKRPPLKVCRTFIFLVLWIPRGMPPAWHKRLMRGTQRWPNPADGEGEFKWCDVKCSFQRLGGGVWQENYLRFQSRLRERESDALATWFIIINP